MKKSNKKVKINEKKMITSIALVVLIIIAAVVCGFMLFNKKKNYKPMDLSFTSGVEKLENFDGKGYYKIGWLQVQGTHMDLPIMESDYLREEETSPSFGWRSSLYETGENVEVLSGHNILNVSNEPMLPNENLTDFEELMAFTYYDFAKDNLYVQYTKDGKDEIYAIYAVGFYNSLTVGSYSMNSKKEINQYIDRAKNTSIYKYDVDVDPSDHLIQLRTCTRYFGTSDNQTFIIDARKLRDDEKIVKYNVKKTKKYDELTKKEEKM